MKTKICLTGLLLALNFSAWGTLSIPDNNSIGLTSTQPESGQGSSITGVTLNFILQGGFSGDLSGYLRLGNTTGSPYYDLTTLIQSQILSGSTPTSYSIDFTTSDFSTAFNGQNPDNTWTLFFADNSPGGTTTLNGWSLDITAVPEPVNVALAVFGVALAVGGFVRRFGRTDKCASI